MVKQDVQTLFRWVVAIAVCFLSFGTAAANPASDDVFYFDFAEYDLIYFGKTLSSDGEGICHKFKIGLEFSGVPAPDLNKGTIYIQIPGYGYDGSRSGFGIHEISINATGSCKTDSRV